MKQYSGLGSSVLILYIAFFTIVLSSHAWDPKAFILERRPEVPLEQGWDIGYDAQWYYYIAVDPIGAEKVLDRPAYRYQRILYPLLVRVFSLGKVSWMPWTMLLVNLAAAWIGTYVLADWLVRHKTLPWFSLIFACSFGYLLGMRLDLLEPLTLTLAVTGWVSYQKGKPSIGILLFALAGMTKEIGLIFPAALSAWMLWRKEWKNALLILAGSMLPFFVWWIYLRAQFGTTSGTIEATRLSWLPFSGLLGIRDAPSLLLVILWVVLPGIVSMLYIFRGILLRKFKLDHPETLLVLAQVVFLAIMPHATWVDPLAMVRTGLGLLVAMILWMAVANRRLLPYLAALYLPSGFLALFVQGFISY